MNGRGRYPRRILALAAGAVLSIAAATAPARSSDTIGFFGIVQQVVFEPDPRAPERVQLWGAFAWADGARSAVASRARRGYLYFRLPSLKAALNGS